MPDRLTPAEVEQIAAKIDAGEFDDLDLGALVETARAGAAPDHPETPVHPGRFGTHAAARCLVCRARAAGEAEAIRFAVKNIQQATGPTGGWLRSPANLIENLTGERRTPC